jgi:DNA-directed RNA polymerase subunit E'/Rpb7
MAKNKIKSELVSLRLEAMRLRIKLLDGLIHEAAIVQAMSQEQDAEAWPARASEFVEFDQDLEQLKARLSKLEARMLGAGL